MSLDESLKAKKESMLTHILDGLNDRVILKEKIYDWFNRDCHKNYKEIKDDITKAFGYEIQCENIIEALYYEKGKNNTKECAEHIKDAILYRL